MQRMSRILVDTNLLIYGIDKDSRFFTRYQKLLSNQKFELFSTSKNLSEFLSVVTRGPTTAIPVQNAIDIIKDYTDFITILYPSENSFSIVDV